MISDDSGSASARNKVGSRPENRPILVADTVHGSIPLSRLEKEVISTQLFNRLHNVLQNSTVYYTYPSNRTSRFSHSLGVMHLAGEIYYRSILNADEGTQVRFLKELSAEVSDILTDPVFRSDSTNRLSNDFLTSRELASPLVTNDIDVVYQDNLPRLPGGGKHNRAYLIGFQAIRLAGLLHDAGHPPLSHVAEYALGEIREEIVEKKVLGKPTTAREEHFLAVLENVAPGNKKIHEGVGKRLAGILISRAVGQLCNGTQANGLRTLVYLLCEHLALRILSDRTRLGAALHCIVDGDFDADRLDYVTRDTLSCGISGEPFRYERLRNGLRLVFAPGPDKTDSPQFLPSVRSISDVERFYRLRQELYKYVVHHHRVVRTDGLLKVSIQHLAREHLLGTAIPRVGEDGAALPADISGLWAALEPGRLASQRESVETFIRWDDPWLITTLRDAYFLAVKKREQNPRRSRPSRVRKGLGQAQVEPSLLEMLLEETLSDSRYYHSLYKGIDSFLQVDQAFLDAIPLDLDLAGILSTTERDRAGVAGQVELMVEFRSLRANEASVTRLRQQHGFFACIARKLNQLAKRPRTDRYLDFATTAASGLLRQFRGEYQLRDVLVVPKVLKPGLDEEFLLHDEGKPYPLRNVSRLVHDLEINAAYFPPFFTYIASEQRPDDPALEELRTAFGKGLAAAFLEKVRQ